MKNQKILILTGALLLAGLVACKPNTSSSEVPPSSSEPTSQAPSSEVEEKEMTVEEAEALHEEFLHDNTYTLTSFGYTTKYIKQKGDIVEEYQVVTVKKAFNEEKEPGVDVNIKYEVDF